MNLNKLLKELGPEQALKELQKSQARRSLHSFIKYFWDVVEPKEFIDSWHLKTICDHLEAVYDGRIPKLVINIPPRHTKSISCTVMFPAWIWLQEPGSQFLTNSYAQSLSTRDNIKRRRIVQSQKYQELMESVWSGFELIGDQNTKLRYETSYAGYCIATSVTGTNTGEGGDFIIVDDPHNVKETESATKRESVLSWWDETMSSRINSPKRFGKVIIMQRTHEADLSGHCLKKKGWQHLCLPGRYEGENRIKTILNTHDYRTKKGQPLWPQLYGIPELDEISEEMQSQYAEAAQIQQNPTPREGGMFKKKDFIIIDYPPDENKIVSTIRYWDKAGTEEGGKYTAGVKMHRLKDGSYLVSDVVRGQWSAHNRERHIKSTAEKDGKFIRIWVEQEPGSGGKESAQATISNLAGWRVKADKVTGAKEVRAEPFADQVEGENVYVLNRHWTRTYINEHGSFPRGMFGDQVDASAGAFNKLAKGRNRTGTWGRAKKAA